jgi:hypothetical protein
MHCCAAMTNQEQQQSQTKLLALFVAGINARNSRRQVPSEPIEIDCTECHAAVPLRDASKQHLHNSKQHLHKKSAITGFEVAGDAAEPSAKVRSPKKQLKIDTR